MKALRTIFQNASRTLAFALIAVALFAATGCSLLLNEEDGDKDAIAEYVVTVNPSSKSKAIATTDTVVPFSAEVGVRCVGPVIPESCATHKPFWRFYTPSPFVSKVMFGNEESPNTTVTVFFDAQKYLSAATPNSLTGNKTTTSISLYPASVPSSVALRGFGHLTVVTLPLDNGAIEERKEHPPDEPGLVVSEKSQFLFLEGTLPNVTKETAIYYSGPDTTISEIGVSGPGAAKFEVVSPKMGDPIGLGTPLTVRFKPDVLDVFTTHRALLTINTANNTKPTYVSLSGRRDP